MARARTRLASIKSHVVPSWEGINNLVGEPTDVHQGQWVGRGHIASRHIEWFASRARLNAPCLLLPPSLSVNLRTTDWVATVFSVEHNCSTITSEHNCSTITGWWQLEPNTALVRGGSPRHRAATRTIGTCFRLRGPLKRERIFDTTDEQKAGDIFGQPLRTSTKDGPSSWKKPK